MGRAEKELVGSAGLISSGPASSFLSLLLIAYPTNPFHSRPSAMATATLLSSSFAMPAAARRASSGFATSQLAGLSLSAGAATPTAVALLPKRQQLQPIVARESSISISI